MYNQLYKPFEITIRNGKNIKFYYAENNPTNRLLVNYKDTLVIPLMKLGFKLTKIPTFLNIYPNAYLFIADIKNGKIPLPNSYNLNSNQINEIYNSIYALNPLWEKYYKTETEELIADEEHINDEANRIKDGEVFAAGVRFKWEGGTTPKQRCSYCKKINDSMSLSDFKKNRNLAKTKELLENIDSLSLEEIHKTYLNKWGCRNEK